MLETCSASIIAITSPSSSFLPVRPILSHFWSSLHQATPCQLFFSYPSWKQSYSRISTLPKNNGPRQFSKKHLQIFHLKSSLPFSDICYQIFNSTVSAIDLPSLGRPRTESNCPVWWKYISYISKKTWQQTSHPCPPLALSSPGSINHGLFGLLL